MCRGVQCFTKCVLVYHRVDRIICNVWLVHIQMTLGQPQKPVNCKAGTDISRWGLSKPLTWRSHNRSLDIFIYIYMVHFNE